MGLKDRFEKRLEEDRAYRLEEAKRRQAKELAREKEAYQNGTSPTGAAHQAYERGDGYLELELDFRATGSSSVYTRNLDGSGLLGGAVTSRGNDLLSQIEAEGWTLTHVDYVYVPISEDSRDIFLRSGQQTAIRGKIVGAYLFKRKD